MRYLILLLMLSGCTPVPGLRRHDVRQAALVRTPTPHRAVVSSQHENRVGGTFSGRGAMVSTRDDGASGNIVADRLMGGRIFFGHQFIDLFGGYEYGTSRWSTAASANSLNLENESMHMMDGGAEIAVYKTPIVSVKLIGSLMMIKEERQKEETVTVFPDDGGSSYSYEISGTSAELSFRPLFGVDVHRKLGERVGIGAGISGQTIRSYPQQYRYERYCGVSESGNQLECEDGPDGFTTELVVNPQLRLHLEANQNVGFDLQVWTQVATGGVWNTARVPGGASVGMRVHYGWNRGDFQKPQASR